MISMFMQGGPSHIDLFDPKPELNRLHMQTYGGSIKYDNAGEASSRLFGCPWRFRRYGECGMDFSEPAAALGEIADEICMIRSMQTGVNNHGESINALNTGRQLPGRPALGAWLTWGLGSRNQRLPGFLVLTDPSGLPVLGVENWQNGWLPSIYQGTVVRPQEPRILNLDPPASLKGGPQQRLLSYLGALNNQYLTQHPGEHDLSARMQSYELAAAMQTSAREALDITQETAATQSMYGLDRDETRDYGTRCLIARRLVERGVRFVQVWHGEGQPWDNHDDIEVNHRRLAKQCDQAIGALLTDLKQRGLLEETLVIWGGEFGRTPVVELPTKGANAGKINGRDHNHWGFTMWMAGGGVRGGYVHGATDEFGFKAVENTVHVHDLHATILKLIGFDHEKFTYRYAGRDFRLTDVHGRVVEELIA